MDYGLEPLQRARSNTWPLPRPDAEDGGSQMPEGSPSQLLDVSVGGLVVVGSGGSGASGGVPSPSGSAALHQKPQQHQQGGPQQQQQLQQQLQGGGPVKKTSSRRNAWGNQSYADLITQAISSVPEQRLTLSQIYEWMVQNVPYFKDKGDSNSSAGWKNSIRHNLSLHNRFEKIQNEGTGKSSWWQINHSATRESAKSRRRAASMETSKFEKKRGRVKKVVEALRNSLNPENTPSPSSSISENSDMIPVSPVRGVLQQYSPNNFRDRTSSNASSTGRLSPIFSEQLSTADYGLDSVAEQGQADQLAGTLAQTIRLSQTLESYSDVFRDNRGPPPPYCSLPLQLCPIHGYQGCSCFSINNQLDNTYIKQECITFDENILNNDQPDDSMSATVIGQIMGSSHSPFDEVININMDKFTPIECNVEEVIKHEFNLEGCLGDFNNFNPPAQPQPSASTAQTLATVSHDQSQFNSGHQWVH
ncbi:Fork head domain conserved site 2,Fork head domain,Winged helix-turn-helix DNA-binding domain [Cinara cedri]|uniref:Forkhead box protein O n=1 Tax=Cinara cedri TaxID=506608 RepID=A0A5E4NM06_9HEMI|nr:Fork head domain conserved site 2,Fork head domain,Winged helix-turn-helix DNA-binding domain [Cinara cedri]